jgi:hypothetical protein
MRRRSKIRRYYLLMDYAIRTIFHPYGCTYNISCLAVHLVTPPHCKTGKKCPKTYERYWNFSLYVNWKKVASDKTLSSSMYHIKSSFLADKKRSKLNVKCSFFTRLRMRRKIWELCRTSWRICCKARGGDDVPPWWSILH